ncbi:hypothetical protein DL95DRAFT_155392 [Leptodontidium sp. 2 PMI_412]|nr:hypothetical protein DL95DRAFT_155392 [Leptodontidium sp. 2 PMI_412]
MIDERSIYPQTKQMKSKRIFHKLLIFDLDLNILYYIRRVVLNRNNKTFLFPPKKLRFPYNTQHHPLCISLSFSYNHIPFLIFLSPTTKKVKYLQYNK